MPTAIVRVYTTQGFVIASDGLLVKRDGTVHSREYRKITHIVNRRESIGLAITGHVGLSFNLLKLSEGILHDLANRRSKWGLSKYTKHIEAMMLKSLKPIEDDEDFKRLESKHGKATVSRLLLSGYFEGAAFMADVHAYSQNNGKPKLRVCSQNPEFFSDGSHVNASGSDKVWWALVNPENVTFISYRKPSVRKFMRHEPLTLSDGIEIAENYIRACSDHSKSLLVDDDCRLIGGRIQIATLTLDCGFQWIPGFEPLVTNTLNV